MRGVQLPERLHGDVESAAAQLANAAPRRARCEVVGCRIQPARPIEGGDLGIRQMQAEDPLETRDLVEAAGDHGARPGDGRAAAPGRRARGRATRTASARPRRPRAGTACRRGGDHGERPARLQRPCSWLGPSRPIRRPCPEDLGALLAALAPLDHRRADPGVVVVDLAGQAVDALVGIDPPVGMDRLDRAVDRADLTGRALHGAASAIRTGGSWPGSRTPRRAGAGSGRTRARRTGRPRGERARRRRTARRGRTSARSRS